MEGTIRVRLLGAVQVERDGKPVRGFRSRKALALLGYLAVQDQPVFRERLVDLLWEDKTESQGRNNLSWVLNKISSLLPDLLQADRHTVQFQPTVPHWLDTEAFKELEAKGDPSSLASAVELYRGEFLEGLYFEGCAEFELWVVGERERWRQHVVDVLWELISHYDLHGEYELSLRFARRLLALNPWQEEAHQHLMQSLARLGQRSAALAQYESCRQTLAEELGIEPTQATRELYDRIYALTPARRQNLPAHPTAFVGREEELAEVCQLLSRPDCRLLTILGPGGIGKTRLALQAANAKIEAFLEGVYFVPLAAVSSAEFIVSAIADTLQFPLTDPLDPQAQLFSYLRGKEVLLILDSFEHLLDGTPLLVDLLREAPEVKLLVTSRERLNLRWEWQFEIQGLAYPADGSGTDDSDELTDYGAAQLFLQTALRAHPSFLLSSRNRSAMVRICRLVEGVPLGLELAAALVKTHTCEEIAREIEHNLGFLATAFRDMPKRQRSIRATYEHSWQLLTPPEQSALAQLSVFRGGFEAEAASKVASATPSILESLASKSLLRFVPTGRYEMHELSRQYAAEKLATTLEAEEETRDRHCAYYTTLLQLRKADLTGAGAAETLTAIRADIANVRAAWHWAVTQAKMEEIERGLDGLPRFCLLAGLYQEGEALIRMTVDRVRALIEKADKPKRDLQVDLGKSLAEQARFLNRLGMYDQAIAAAREAADLARTEQAVSAEAVAYLQWCQALWRRGAFDAAETRLEQALTLARAASLRQVEADSLRILGNISHNRGAYTEARSHFEQALSIYREIGDGRGEGGSLNNLGVVCQGLGDNTGATAYYEQALIIYHQIGDRQVGGAALHNLARVSLQQGSYSEARAYLEQALQIWRDVGDRQGEGWGLLNLGCIALEQSDYAASKVRCEQALRVFRDIGDRRGESNALIDLGHALHLRGSYSKASTCLEQALLICREIGDRQGECWALGYLGSLSAECGDYAGATADFEQALLISREIGDRQGEASGLADLCLLLHQLGDDQTALQHGQQALLIAQELGDRPTESSSLAHLGCVLARLGRLAEAAEVCQQALDLQRELGEHALATESLAALARVSLAQSNLALAQAQADEILIHLENNSLEGTDEPFRVYLTCYRVLRANQDPRAHEILVTAHRLLQERAVKISDDKLRRSFLENVAAHREIVEEVDRLSANDSCPTPEQG